MTKNICYKCKRPITTGKLCEACKIKYNIKPYLPSLKRKYSYNKWKRKMLAKSEISEGEFLTNTLLNGKPLANLYLEKCPTTLKKVYYWKGDSN